jgi:hypothetical protein
VGVADARFSHELLPPGHQDFNLAVRQRLKGDPEPAVIGRGSDQRVERSEIHGEAALAGPRLSR